MKIVLNKNRTSVYKDTSIGIHMLEHSLEYPTFQCDFHCFSQNITEEVVISARIHYGSLSTESGFQSR